MSQLHIGRSVLLLGLFALLWWGRSEFGLSQTRRPLQAATTTPPGLRVMTWNAYFLNKNSAAFFAIVATEQPDLIAIQELGAPLAEAISARLLETFPFQLLYPSKIPAGMAILSRYPFHSTVPPDFNETTGCNCQIVTLDFAGQLVTIINAHPWPAKSLLTGGELLEFNTDHQDRIFDQLLQRMQQISSPLVVMGDLNTISIQPNYRRLRRLLHDAYVESGIGPANTFSFSRDASNWLAQPLIRIDYIFYDDAWQAHQTWVGTNAGSDHRYVVADLLLLP